MKLTKGKKQDDKEKKVKAKLPEPPAPIRIQVEPRKADSVSLEVKVPPMKTVKGRRQETPSGKESAKAAGVKVEVKPKTAKPDSVTKVEVKTKAAPSAKPAKPAPERPREILGSTLTRPEMYRKASTVTLSSPSGGGSVSANDMKIIKDFLSRIGYLDNKIAEVNIKLSKIARVSDIFTDKVNSSQKELGDLKMRVASLKEERLGRDVSELKERSDEMESILEKMSDRLKEAKEESERTIASETKKMKSVREDMAGLQSGVKDLRGTLDSLNIELRKLGDFKAFVQDRAKQPDKDIAPDAIKNVTDRFDSMDSRIANMSDKLMKVGRDMEKLTDYFMDGIKHMESRIMSIEKEKDAEKRFSGPPAETFIPTTYRSHLRHPELQTPRERTIITVQQSDSGGQVARAAFNQESAFRKPEAYDDDDSDLDMDIDDDYDMPRRQAPMPIPGVAMPQPPGPPGSGPKAPPAASGKLPAPPAPDRGAPFEGRRQQTPSNENLFTRLRESTVVRRPIEQIDPDMDIILEHIRDSTRLHEPREKITRDLMNAGFDQSLVNQAFMRYRVG